MKILLISINNETDPYPVAPIGIAYIANALRNKGHNVRSLDLCFIEDDSRAVENLLRNFSPDVIGISIRNIDNLTFNKSIFYMPRIKHIVNSIKDHTLVPIVVGGSGFSIFPEEVLRYLELETGIIGEGEVAFTIFIDAVNNGGDISSIHNLCFIKDGEFRFNGMQYSNVNHRPDRSILNNRTYLELGGMANIQSKRGCPFKCTYCTYPAIEGNQLRLRESADVVEELKEMQSEYDIDHVFFVDDIFNFPGEHAVALCEEIIRNNLKIDWTCFATPKGMVPELAMLMKRAGCKGVEFGSDAGSEKTLEGFGKPFTPEDIAYATECCKDVDLPNAHYIIIGGPYENNSTLKETFNLFDKIKTTAVIALIGVRIYPNTQLYKRAIEDNVIEEDRNLLEPVFYLTKDMDVYTMLQKVSTHANQRHNWIVPGLNIRCNTDILNILRKKGKRGPLWDMLS